VSVCARQERDERRERSAERKQRTTKNERREKEKRAREEREREKTRKIVPLLTRQPKLNPFELVGNCTSGSNNKIPAKMSIPYSTETAATYATFVQTRHDTVKVRREG